MRHVFAECLGSQTRARCGGYLGPFLTLSLGRDSSRAWTLVSSNMVSVHQGFIRTCFMRPAGWARLSGKWSSLAVTGVLHPLIVLRLGRVSDLHGIVFFPESSCFLEQNLHLPFVFSLSSFHVTSPFEVTFITSGGRTTP